VGNLLETSTGSTDAVKVRGQLSPERVAADERRDAQEPVVGVLVVDDQAPFRSVARSLVELVKGWQVVGEASSGEEAVELAAAIRPRVVLMDINLPGITGIEATRRIVAADPDAAVVLVSTYAADDLPDDALSCGAVGYVRKDDLTPRLLRSMLGG
jgi:two-component system, NarL family, invasion response regulator UvrY